MAGASDELTEDHWIDFERLLRESDDACRLYVEYVDMSRPLAVRLGGMPTKRVSPFDVFFWSTQEPDAPCRPSPSLGHPLHSTVGYFSEGMPLAYLLATVITGLGLLVGSLIHVSHPEQVARNPPSVAVEPNA